MGRVDKVGCRRKSNRRVRSNEKGSDESDEDYVISEEEEEEESEADLEQYCSSLDGKAPDEVDEDLEETEVKQRNVVRPNGKKGHCANWKTGTKNSRKTNKVLSDEEEDVDFEEDEEEEVSRTAEVGRRRVKTGSVVREEKRGVERKRRRVLFNKGDEDDDYREDEDNKEEDDDGFQEEEIYTEKVRENLEVDSLHNGEIGVIKSHETEDEDGDYEEEEDEEFTPDEYVSLEEEEEEERAVRNRNNKTSKACKKTAPKRKSGGRRKRKRKYSAAKPRLSKDGKNMRGRKRKKRSNEDDEYEDDFVDDGSLARDKVEKKSSKRRRRYSVPSDSDFAESAESDYEYTISEEEREQIREANRLLRSKSRRQTQVVEDLPQARKYPVKKGKEKVEAAKKEVINHVCGICLSEEDKRRLRGTLDSCSHYFCFTCIMEWSKVESRCPLCKQRFRTISKPARSALGLDLREVVIPVAERDQVYQPSEEELRSYLDPYENVICTECHQGGDDGLMLLCDLCDSSAHTYCVGLGHTVPEGNWYCEGCRPVAHGSPSRPAHHSPLSEQRMINEWYNRPSSPSIHGESLDARLLMTSPRTPFFHGFENLFPPRLHPNADVQGSSPSASGAPTLSRRRTLHRHIQNIINSNRLNSMAGRADERLNINRTNGFMAAETSVPSSSIHGGTEPVVSSRREEVVVNTSVGNSSINLGLWPGLAQADPMTGNQQHQPNMLNMSVFRVAPDGDFSIAREQLQLTVKTHLKNLSGQIGLGQATFNEIATCSIHTILAACGLHHRSSEVHVVPPPVTCPHGETSSSNGCSLMKHCCSACFDSFVKGVVKMIMETRQPHWLSLGL